jgi:type II secretory pathway pseudopilin PulG
MAKNIFRGNRGYTLIEMLVYVGLIGIIFLVIVSFTMIIGRTNSRIVSLIKLNSAASAAMERMSYEIKNAARIYTPTSNFATTTNPQLSLATAIGAQAGENLAYIDFYLENNTIFFKQEGASPVALTPPGISVQDLSFNYYKNGARESVKIDFIARPASGLSSAAAVHLAATVALR